MPGGAGSPEAAGKIPVGILSEPRIHQGPMMLPLGLGHLHRQAATVPPANLSASKLKFCKSSDASSSSLSSFCQVCVQLVYHGLLLPL